MKKTPSHCKRTYKWMNEFLIEVCSFVLYKCSFMIDLFDCGVRYFRKVRCREFGTTLIWVSLFWKSHRNRVSILFEGDIQFLSVFLLYGWSCRDFLVLDGKYNMYTTDTISSCLHTKTRIVTQYFDFKFWNVERCSKQNSFGIRWLTKINYLWN